jgi:putative membrane protein
MLSAAEHQRVHEAILAAEAKTAGDIACIVARESASYREVPIAWAAIAAVAAPPILLLLGLRPAAAVAWIEGGWLVPVTGGVDEALTIGAVAYAAAQALIFAVVLAIVAIPAVRRAFSPGFVKHAHVHARAMELYAHRRHVSAAPASILIYASMAERRVEIIASDDIHAKCGEAPWQEAVAAAAAELKKGAAAAGLIAAINRCTTALAAHYPPDGKPRTPDPDDVTEV